MEWPTIAALRDAERLQQRARVHRHIVKVVRDDGFRGAAESDLIRHDDAKACLAQGFDGTAEVKAAEVHSVEQNHGAPVRLARGWNVHIRHAHVLAVECQRQIHHWIWIRDVLVGDTARLYIGRSLHHRVSCSCAGLGMSVHRERVSAGENYDEAEAAVGALGIGRFCHFAVGGKIPVAHDIRRGRILGDKGTT